MKYGMVSEMQQGFNFLLKRIDPFGFGMKAEELFPDLFEEAEFVGVDIKERFDCVNSMGFLLCIDGLDPDLLFFVGDSISLENDLIRYLDQSKASPENNENYFYGDEVVSDQTCEACGCLSVIVTQDFERAKKLHEKNDFVMICVPNGSAAFL